MSKPKLKIRLEKFERALVFQVLEQDERFRVRDRSEMVEFNSKRFPIFSSAHPYLDSAGRVYLRGSDTKADWSVMTLSFMSNVDRDGFYAKPYRVPDGLG